MLSAGTDRSFRVFHTVRDCLSQELSQKPLVKVSHLMFVTILVYAGIKYLNGFRLDYSS